MIFTMVSNIGLSCSNYASRLAKGTLPLSNNEKSAANSVKTPMGLDHSQDGVSPVFCTSSHNCKPHLHPMLHTNVRITSKLTHVPHRYDGRHRWYECLLFWRRTEHLKRQQRASELENSARQSIVQDLMDNQPSGEITEILMKAFSSGHHEELNCLRGEKAQCALDLLQDLLLRDEHRTDQDSVDHIRKEVRWLLQRRLQKLACEASLLPSQIIVKGVRITTKRTLGHGGYADVYPGTWRGAVAVKHLRTFNSISISHAEALRRDFFREAVLWFNLGHRHVLHFVGISEGSDDLPGFCMILQWAENRDIRRYLDIRIRSGLSGASYVSRVNTWVRGIPAWKRYYSDPGEQLHEIILGLEYLHLNGVVHGDLRGVNILIGDKETALLADFGLSVIADIGGSYTCPSSGRSIAWAAPELLSSQSGSTRPTFESDIYSFGCVCVEVYLNGSPFGESELRDYQIIHKVLKGKRPDRPRVEGREVTDELWAAIKSCWGQDPFKRPKTSEAVKLLSKATKN